MDSQTIKVRERYFEHNGWIANTMAMGNKGQVEFILDRKIINEDFFFLAVGLMPESNPETIIPFPEYSAGDCASNSLVAGDPETEYAFSPESWYKIALD